MKSNIFFVLGFVLLVSCTKSILVDSPNTGISSDNAFASDASATGVVTGIYASMSATKVDGTGATGAGGGVTAITLFAGLSADELAMITGAVNATPLAFYKNALTLSPAQANDPWTRLYPVIFTANSAIENLNKSSTLTPAVKQQLLGESKFIRAFAYFYLVNLYGDASLVTGTDYTANEFLPRAKVTDIYTLIKTDLTEAESLLSQNYLDGTLVTTSADRVRPTKWAAAALLARVYLYTGDYTNADTQASLVISNSSQFALSTLSNAFLRASTGNKEAIWQLQPVATGYNTNDGQAYVLPATGPSTSLYPYVLNNNLVNAFEVGDQRKTSWVGNVTIGVNTYYYDNKYKISSSNAPVTEHLSVLRLAEQYLIRAEARAQNSDVNGSKLDLNVIRTRAGLLGTTATDKASLLIAIAHERQTELFMEWGHRWLDLKRSGTVDAVMTMVTPQKGSSAWKPTQALYPIPLVEIQKNFNLLQNPGY